MANLQLQFGSYYFSTPAATTLSAATPAKASGTTTEMASNGFTVTTSNRMTYTGTPTLKFKIDCFASMSTATGADTVFIMLYKNGSLITGSKIERKVSNNDTGSGACGCIVSLATNDYVELWIESTGGDNVTIDEGCVMATIAG